MSFSENFPDADIFDALGDNVIYQRGVNSYTLNACINQSIDNTGNQSHIIERTATIDLLLADLPIYPQRLDKIIDNNIIYVIDAIIRNDGKVVTLAAKRQ